MQAAILQQAIDIYLRLAYAGTPVPQPTLDRIAGIRALPSMAEVPTDLLEQAGGAPGSLACRVSYAIRLGQPTYPHMKVMIESCPNGQSVLRVDTHDKHLHAAPGSPDEQWLTQIRAANKAITDQIEAAWAAAGLPTFKEYLRKDLAARRAKS